MKKKGSCFEHYGSATVGERGQLVLPIDARNEYNIKPGDKLVVMGSETGNFKHLVLMKSEELAGMVNYLFEIEKYIKGSREGNIESINKLFKTKEVDKYLKEGGAKRVEEILKKEIKKKK
ncbi:MAG: hypothetical protein CL943_03285 [Candidatus Diapherotrites archaeon]|uniref:SpoVT-AbrB domain-containing protein n=1 Tax=Candidatus Iainarchaeum sp. TaxID=3101447 RepID=A0A2D6M1K1_9ARCH|nr:hypothetical protein [Candidatus Diapherotrites archaeon]|tara:strand:+ start:1019 stop:1378 length:360 start_codon:yes stop_codon:yes gene_type:complete